MIEVRDVTKRYGDKVAVRDLTFTVQPGVVTGFLGPNGAGKSTTMRIIAGLDAPTHGSLTVNGHRYADATAPMAAGRRAPSSLRGRLHGVATPRRRHNRMHRPAPQVPTGRSRCTPSALKVQRHGSPVIRASPYRL